MNRNIFVILILGVLFASCSDLFDPALENIRGKDNIYNEPNFAQGLLTNGYARIPTSDWSFNDVATDDAVSNDVGNSYLKMATGQWTASNNPMDRWSTCNTGVQYMNMVIAEVDKVTFSDDEKINLLFRDRIKGEAYGLRGILMYYLLQAHAGWVNGKLLGFPIFLTEQTATSDFNVPRADFNACTAQIYSDLSEAESRLPLDYVDIATGTVPAKYTAQGITDYTMYNRVFGVKFLGQVSGRIVQAMRSKVALLAASPAFAAGSNGKWEDAAVYAAQIVKLKGGANALPAFASGLTWYNNSSEISGITAGSNPPEILWRAGRQDVGLNIETDNFPPTLWGNGKINPTQNLVDAFPDKNGYPVASSSVFDGTKPYDNRDPRLKAFILVHGATLRGTTINILSGDDAVKQKQNSTRTGYYLLKLLRQDVNLNPAGQAKQYHYTPRIRYTEIYLNYAEAANEAWGPLADPKSYGFTAYDIIKAIRKRALTGMTTDSYLESIKSDQVAMRKLIRNERRLELCFEGFRFWDLRRWNVPVSELNASANGITITGTLASPVYNSTTVENRVYQNYMIYGPVPYSETLKFSNLLQNDGWK